MPKNKALKLVIDTNLWISFIISNKLNLLDPLLFAGDARFIFSVELISEIKETMAKPRLKKIFGQRLLKKCFPLLNHSLT